MTLTTIDRIQMMNKELKSLRGMIPLTSGPLKAALVARRNELNETVGASYDEVFMELDKYD